MRAVPDLRWTTCRAMPFARGACTMPCYHRATFLPFCHFFTPPITSATCRVCPSFPACKQTRVLYQLLPFTVPRAWRLCCWRLQLLRILPYTYRLPYHTRAAMPVCLFYLLPSFATLPASLHCHSSVLPFCVAFGCAGCSSLLVCRNVSLPLRHHYVPPLPLRFVFYTTFFIVTAYHHLAFTTAIYVLFVQTFVRGSFGSSFRAGYRCCRTFPLPTRQILYHTTALARFAVYAGTVATFHSQDGTCGHWRETTPPLVLARGRAGLGSSIHSPPSSWFPSVGGKLCAKNYALTATTAAEGPFFLRTPYAFLFAVTRRVAVTALVGANSFILLHRVRAGFPTGCRAWRGAGATAADLPGSCAQFSPAVVNALPPPVLRLLALPEQRCCWCGCHWCVG